MKINVLGVNHLLITDAICDQVVERFQKIANFFAPIKCNIADESDKSMIKKSLSCVHFKTKEIQLTYTLLLKVLNL